MAEECSGEGLVLHSACQEDYKTLAAVAVAYGHVLVAESPIDINIAKQLNILLSDASVDLGRVLIDPLTGGLGYGLEYTYSVMERIRLAALGGDADAELPGHLPRRRGGLEGQGSQDARGEGAARGATRPRAASTGRSRRRCRCCWRAPTSWCCAIPRRSPRVRRQLDAWFDGGRRLAPWH